MSGVIYNKDGLIVGTGKDTSRFLTDSKGNIIDPSTNDLLINIRNILDNRIDEFVSNLAKEITLNQINSKLSVTQHGLKVDVANIVPLTISSSVLPNGAATENTLQNINSKIESTNLGIKVDTSHITQNVVVQSLPLPNDAARNSTLTNGQQVTKIADGNGNLVNVTNNSLNVNVKSIEANINLNNTKDSVLIYGKYNNQNVPLTLDENGFLNVKVSSFSLPENAATETTLQQINSKITGPLALENGNLLNIRNSINEINSKVDLLSKDSTLLSILSRLNVNNDNILKVDASQYPINVNVLNIPQIPGLATETTLLSINSKVYSINAYSESIFYQLLSLNQKTKSNSDGNLIVDASRYPINVNVNSGINYSNSSVVVFGNSGTSYVALATDNIGRIKVSNDNLPSLENQISILNNVSSINNYVSNLRFDNNNNLKVISYQPSAYKVINETNSPFYVTVSSLPLPPNAATVTEQITANNLLNSIKNIIERLSFTNDNRLLVESVINLNTEVEIKNDVGNPLFVNVTSSVLPSGAATSAKQDIAINYLSEINNKLNNFSFNLNNKLKVEAEVISIPEVEIKNDSGNPLNITAVSLPLPTGASTEAKQDISNNLLTQIKNQTDKFSFSTLNELIIRENDLRAKITKCNTDNVIVAQLPLPPGAATADKQDQIYNRVSDIYNLLSEYPITVNVSSSALPVGAATENTLSNINNKIGEVSASPNAQTILGRLKSIVDTLLSIFDGTKLLGYFRQRSFYTNNNYIYNIITNQAANSTTTLNLATVPAGQTWHVKRITVGRSVIISTNNTAISRFTIQRNGVNLVTLASSGHSVSFDLELTFTSGQQISAVVTNGNTTADNFITIIYEVET